MGRNMGSGMRSLHRLSAVKVTNLKQPGYYADGGNLYLRVAPGGSKGWIFRFASAGRTRDAGLGSYPTVSIIRAREAARRCREMVAAGVDPIEARKRDRQAALVASAKTMTFEQCAKAFIASHSAAWRSVRQPRLWSATLADYVYPAVGTLPVSAIDTPLVRRVLEPIWVKKPETASRVRARIERVLDWAKVHGYREGENPARWRGHLDNLLPNWRKVRAVQHHSAMPYREIPALMEKLRADPTAAARALELLVLTATRVSETLGARWDEINLNERIWIIAAARTKSGREHRIPLASRSVAVLEEMAKFRNNEFVFAGAREGRPVTRTVLLNLGKRLGLSVTNHGFRSSFRDWAGEQTNFPREVAELSLAHSIGDAVERAYARGDLLEKRRKLMEAWAAYCGRKPASADVLPFGRKEGANG
jgi:integrase